MRPLTCTPLIALAISFAPGIIAAKEITPELRTAVDEYLDQRFLSPDQAASATKSLVAKLTAAKVTAPQLEALLRSARHSYPATPEKGKLLPAQKLTCDHVDYSTEYFLYVPKSYDHKKPSSLMIVGHGGNGAMNKNYASMASKTGTIPWLALAEKHGFLIAAPLSERGWATIGDSIVLSTISQMQRRFNVDPDRIYLTGHSMGGHLTYRSGIFMPDRWAAISPMSGGYDYVENKQVYNLRNVPGYSTFGTNEPYQINTFNNRISKWMEDHHFDWIMAEKQGGHTIFKDELPKIARFFAEHPRDLYRKQVFVRNSGDFRHERADANPRWNATHKWTDGRVIDRSTFHWLRLIPLTDGKVVQTVLAEIVDRQNIRITASNARKIRIYLHPKMVDLEKPITVSINGENVLTRKFESNLETMLTLAREFDDRGRIFYVDLLLQVPGDNDPGEPKGDKS